MKDDNVVSSSLLSTLSSLPNIEIITLFLGFLCLPSSLQPLVSVVSRRLLKSGLIGGTPRENLHRNVAGNAGKNPCQ